MAKGVAPVRTLVTGPPGGSVRCGRLGGGIRRRM